MEEWQTCVATASQSLSHISSRLGPCFTTASPLMSADAALMARTLLWQALFPVCVNRTRGVVKHEQAHRGIMKVSSHHRYAPLPLPAAVTQR